MTRESSIEFEELDLGIERGRPDLVLVWARLWVWRGYGRFIQNFDVILLIFFH